MIAAMDGPATSADSCVASAEQHLERGEPLLAYNDLQVGLERWPEHPRLRQLQALALARSGDIERANRILDALAREGCDDAETLGMLARTHKDLALRASDPSRRSAHLASGFRLYEQAYEAARRDRAAAAAWYTGINAATVAALMGRLERAREIAAQVRDLCAAHPSADYWREATLGEAALILGDGTAAAAHYARAAGLAGRRYGDLSTTRRQARLLAQHLPDAPRDVAEVLAIPPVLAFTGHMIDEPQRALSRFPASLESTVCDAIRRRLADI